MAVRCSVGLPLMALTRSARPSLRPRTPSCEMGFCSKNSLTNSWAYRRVNKYLVGRKSFSDMDCERSRIRMRCRMIPRCSGVVSFRSLDERYNLARMDRHCKGNELTVSVFRPPADLRRSSLWYHLHPPLVSPRFWIAPILRPRAAFFWLANYRPESPVNHLHLPLPPPHILRRSRPCP
jgi:hypothetical protein